MRSSIVRILVVLVASFSAVVGADRDDVVARWSGGNKDIPAAIAIGADAAFVVGSADGKRYSSIDGASPTNGWCVYTVRLLLRSAEHAHDSLFCTGDDTWAQSTAVTASGALWVTGSTVGRRMPVAGRPLQPRYGGHSSVGSWGDGFVFKRDRNGRLVYATYFGGPGDDVVNAVVADGDGVWIAGATTSSSRLPGAIPAAQPGAGADGFLTRLSESGTGRGQRVGGNGEDYIMALTRGRGALVVAGTTTSTGGIFGDSRGRIDSFVAAIDPATGKLRWLRRVGSVGDDYLTKVAVLSDGSIVATGRSSSPDCTRSTEQLTGWLVTLTAAGNAPLIRCLGGRNGSTIIHDVAAGGSTVWVTGHTDARDFPTTTTEDGARPLSSFRQAFVTRMNPHSGALLESRLLGSNQWPRRHYSEGRGVATRDGAVIVAGDIAGSFGGRVPSGGGDILPTAGAFGFGERFVDHDSFVVSFTRP